MTEEINQVNEPTYAKNQMDMYWNRKADIHPIGQISYLIKYENNDKYLFECDSKLTRDI